MPTKSKSKSKAKPKDGGRAKGVKVTPKVKVRSKAQRRKSPIRDFMTVPGAGRGRPKLADFVGSPC